MAALIASVVFFSALFLWVRAFGGRLPPPMRERICQGRVWRRAFPDVPKSDIRAFLSLVAGAFAFADHERLKLTPSDQILGIYRAIYPNKGWHTVVGSHSRMVRSFIIIY